MTPDKKFIAPGGWFSLNYPASWSEFEDNEDSFLFYNPEEWSGNFRISAYRGTVDKKTGLSYGATTLKQTLKENPSAKTITLGSYTCVYGKEMFMEDEAYYTTHWWVVDANELVLDCSFTVAKGASIDEATNVIASIEVRLQDQKYPAELIPVRLSEIFLINESFEWASTEVKERLKQDFHGGEDDLPKLQKVVDEGAIGPKKKDQWLALGICLCVIVTNEVDGVQWRTLIDGNREVPVLQFVDGRTVDPLKLIWSKIKAGREWTIEAAYHEALNG